MLLLRRIIVILCTIPRNSGDFTYFHLSKHLNRSISPCSNFHAHVCGDIQPNQTVQHMSEQFYRTIAAKQNSRSRNDAIMDDIITAREKGNCEFRPLSYKWSVQQKCGAHFNCYLDEFNYFLAIYKKSGRQTEETLLNFAKYVNRPGNYRNVLNVTSAIVGILVPIYEDDHTFERVVSYYERLHDRLTIIRVTEKAMKTGIFGHLRIRDLAKRLKEVIANRFKETLWLRETDELSLDLLTQFLIILDEMHLGIEFDEADNLAKWRSFNRFIASRYFEHSKRSTRCARFDVVHSFVTLIDQIEDSVQSKEDWQNFIRITDGLLSNAFYDRTSNSVAFLAPIFYPLMQENSSVSTVYAIAADLSHEFFHPFIRSHFIYSSGTFNSEYECIINHFKKSCDVWDKENCTSGENTFEEDGPDIEALRVAYDLFINDFNEQQRKEFEHADLGITREQAFFYANGVRYCSEVTDDSHSNFKIRLNALASMMPEFTNAFGCQPDDEEYSEERSVCYLFGPMAGFDREQHNDDNESHVNNEAESNEMTGDNNDLEGSGEQASADSKEDAEDQDIDGSGEETEQSLPKE